MPIDGDYVPSPAPWTRKQVELYESTGGAEGATLPESDLRVVVVTSRGHRSGVVRKFALMRVEHEGQYALVASSGGHDRHPPWYWNLKAAPDVVMIQDGPEPFDAVVEEVEGPLWDTWWQRAVAAFPPYADYQARTDRRIPVFVASPVAP